MIEYEYRDYSTRKTQDTQNIKPLKKMPKGVFFVVNKRTNVCKDYLMWYNDSGMMRL